MSRFAALALGLGTVVLAACSFDWEPYDPRVSGSSTSQGAGGAGGSVGNGGAVGQGGHGGNGGQGGSGPVCDHLLDPATSHCYALLEPPLVDWSGGRDACAQLGAGFDLAGVSSQSEHDWLSSQPSIATYLVDELNSAVMWLGGTDAAVEDEWQWVNGEPFFAVWAAGEPSNDGTSGEDCAVYLRRLGAVSYDDRPCDRDFAVLCERAPAGSAP